MLFSFTVTPVFALDFTKNLLKFGEKAGFDAPADSSAALAETIGEIIAALLSILGVLFMIYMVYGGYLWMIARGQEEKVDRAKAIIRGSIVGIIVVLAAYAITSFVVFQVAKATNYNTTLEITTPVV